MKNATFTITFPHGGLHAITTKQLVTEIQNISPQFIVDLDFKDDPDVAEVAIWFDFPDNQITPVFILVQIHELLMETLKTWNFNIEAVDETDK